MLFTVDTYPGQTFNGKVTQVRLNAPQTQNVVFYTVVVTFDNSDLRLLPYLTANLQFQVDGARTCCWSPTSPCDGRRGRSRSLQTSAMRSWRRCKAREAARSRAKEAARTGKEAAAPGQDGGQPSQVAKDAGKEGQPSATSANPGAEAATPARPATASIARQERGRIWIQDGNYVRPVDVRIGVTDGTNTEVTSSKPDVTLDEGMEAVIGESLGGDQPADDTENPFAPKLFRGGPQKKSKG